MDTGWNRKLLHELIVTSATYRQVSRASAELLARDPENRLLARGPQHRLSAEQIRDNALAVSGLLVRKIGGPSVKPYQPAGLWEESGTNKTYQQDKGEALYRRSLYTFWRRTSPPPSMLTFDAHVARIMHCPTRNHVDAAAIAGTAERPSVRGGGPRTLAERLVRERGDDRDGRTKTFFVCDQPPPHGTGEGGPDAPAVPGATGVASTGAPRAAEKSLATGERPAAINRAARGRGGGHGGAGRHFHEPRRIL